MTPAQLLAAQMAHKAHKGHISSLYKLMEQKMKERGKNDPEVRNLEVVLQQAMDASDEAGGVIRAVLEDAGTRVPKRTGVDAMLSPPGGAEGRFRADGTYGGPG